MSPACCPARAPRPPGAPVEVDISKIEPGAIVAVAWRGKPVWVVHRTKEMLDLLGKHDNQLADPTSDAPQQPDYAKNANRSTKPEVLVLVGICTHLGCSPTYKPEVAPEDMGPDWKGGFFCPCHKSKFDLAGRVYKGVPAPANLKIPPYSFLDNG